MSLLICLICPLRNLVLPPEQVEKAPTESYADIGGLFDQIQEIKEAVEVREGERLNE